MRLSKLTLTGFKSFADRTEFSFDEPVIGIVGPNGCGKSNVVDAIKWVLGERSSKSLRGKEMIDVIFAGSAGRKPAGMAAVTLSFENPVVNASAAMVELQYGDHPEVLDGDFTGSNGHAPAVDDPAATAAVSTDQQPGTPEASNSPTPHPPTPLSAGDAPARRRALPIDADVVEVERRLYRDGTSQYLINNRRARLKDIRDLFLDTGIGADAYSIIEQGKVDAMLLASPQERRIIFEEAAGVAKYKQRRIEAQRKLERAQATLALTREQLASTERRLRIVKGQAAKARRFVELDAELRALKMAVAFDQYDDVRRRLEGLTSQLADLDGTRRQATESLASMEQAKQEADVRRHELFTRQKEAEERRLASVHAHEQASQRLQLTERALVEAKGQAEADQQRLVELDAKAEQLRAAAALQAEQVAALVEQLAEADRLVERCTQERAESQRAAAEATDAVGRKRAAVADIERDQAGLAASIEADRRRLETIREELARLAERMSGLDAERAGHALAGEAAADTVARRRRNAEELDRTLAEREQSAAVLSHDRRERADRVASLEQQYLRLDARRHTLAELVESRAGLGDGVRRVLADRDAGRGFAGVLAPLAELIAPDAEFAPAVESALGLDLESLVIGPGQPLPTASDLEALAGRVTFLQLHDGASAMSAWPVDLMQSGRVVPLRRVVQARGDSAVVDAVNRVLDRLLGQTFLVDHLDAGLMVAASIPGARVVTRSGEVLEPDGRLRAGPRGAGDAAGVLQRRVELDQLEIDLSAAKSALDTERVQLAAVDAEVAAVHAEQSELRTRSAAEHRALAGDQARLEQVGAEAARLDRERRELHDQMEELGVRGGWLEQELGRRRERSEALLRLRDDEAAGVAALEAGSREAQGRVESTGEALTAAKIDAGRLAEQTSAARRETRRLTAEAEESNARRGELTGLVEQSAQRVGEHERTIASCREAIAKAIEETTVHTAEAGDIADQARAADDVSRELGERVAGARQQAQAIERDWHALEVARRELEVKREGLEERATEDLRLDLAFEYADYRAMMSGGDVAPLDTAAAGRDIDGLRAEIGRLGSVNLDAMEEENQLAARNDDLIRQVADIDAASKALTDLIEKLNIASKERFGDVFARIQEHFAGPSGMFRKLFGGGKAEVRLMPLVKEIEGPNGVEKVETDEVDLLESGIEVIAKPPGKEPRSISQLSGGEKTLTAVALLLSIFQSKPSCFCVLDEVDAALDEGNVGRFCEVVRQFTTHSHFIVITHNKKTMQATNRLFGVTMQERGVSTRVTVKFEQVGADGQIATPPAEIAATNGHVEPKPSLRRALANMRKDATPVASTA